MLYRSILYFDQSIFVIDPTLGIAETTQSQIRRHSALIEFMDTHCRARAYSFQVSWHLQRNFINFFMQIARFTDFVINIYFKDKKMQ